MKRIPISTDELSARMRWWRQMGDNAFYTKRDIYRKLGRRTGYESVINAVDVLAEDGQLEVLPRGLIVRLYRARE